jgi:phenylpyruvate tautomerase PptA (4-oxalocrotonate tautomerase family)
MPLIQVRVIKDVFSKEQKQQIISRLTDAMVSIEALGAWSRKSRAATGVSEVKP